MTQSQGDSGYRSRGPGLGRPPLDPYWRHRVWSLRAQDRKLTARQIRSRLQAEAEAAGRGPAPSERWVYRALKEFADLSSSEQNQYELARWPESFISGALPWESAATILELLRLLLPDRPTVRVARWFWRVTQAAPAADIGRREAIARELAADEVLGPVQDNVARELEGWLAFRGWELDRPELDPFPGRHPAYPILGTLTLEGNEEEAAEDENEDDYYDEAPPPPEVERQIEYEEVLLASQRRQAAPAPIEPPLSPLVGRLPTYREAVRHGVIPPWTGLVNITQDTPLEVAAEALSEAFGMPLEAAVEMARYWIMPEDEKRRLRQFLVEATAGARAELERLFGDPQTKTKDADEGSATNE